MEEILRGLYLGDDNDVPKAKEKGYARLCCCKDGIDSHRSMLGYTTLGAPKDENYLFARKGNVLALNLIDSPDPEMIPDAAIDAGLNFIKEMQDKGRILFVHCNAGHSRSASIVLAYLHAVGEMPQGFVGAERMFRTIYKKYDPGVGMRSHIRTRWSELPKMFTKG
jgi:Dual specificity phosphatase, catalytic domain